MCWRTRVARTGTGGSRCAPAPRPTRPLRALCRSRRDLIGTRVQVLGQLRANLELAFPGAIGLFTKPASGISLAFWRGSPPRPRPPGCHRGGWAAGCGPLGYTGGISAGVLHGRLPPRPRGWPVPRARHAGRSPLRSWPCSAPSLSRSPCWTPRSARCSRRIQTSTSSPACPRSGTIRAASLLAEIGDCRQWRFPTDDALAALAGACPLTRQPGKRSQTVFRWSCSKKLRAAVMEFATAAAWPTPGRRRLCGRGRGWLPASARDPDPGQSLAADHLAMLRPGALPTVTAQGGGAAAGRAGPTTLDKALVEDPCGSLHPGRFGA